MFNQSLHFKFDRCLQWTKNEIFVAWPQKNKVILILLDCLCSFRYPACNAHAPYCHLWSARLYIFFPNYLITGMIFEKKKRLLSIKCVFRFSLQLYLKHFSFSEQLSDIWSNMYIGISETFLILKTIERHVIKHVYWYIWNISHSQNNWATYDQTCILVVM